MSEETKTIEFEDITNDLDEPETAYEENVEDHTHDGIDSPKIQGDDIDGAIDSSNVVFLTGDQTIAGVKTFTDIPELPATIPTLPSHSISKVYAESRLPDVITVVSDNLRDIADALNENNSTTYTKVKEIEFNNQDGIIATSFSLYSSTSGPDVYARIYINGVAVGIERVYDDYTPIPTYTEDISVNTGDLVQIYSKSEDGVARAKVRYFRLSYDSALEVTEGDVILN